MKPVLGVVGAGGISRFHLRAYQEAGVSVKAVADLRPEAARAGAAPFGAQVTTRYEEVVAHPEVNTVACFGPTPVHYAVCKAALQAGKQLICEKTLTLAGATSLELARLAESRGLIFYTSYMKRFFPAVRKAKELMPQLGHIMSVYCRTYQGGGRHDMHTGEVPRAFRPAPPDGKSPVMRMAGGGILICGGSHIYDLLLYLVGKPTRVYARQLRRPEADCDFMTHAMMDLPDGGVVHFEGNWHPLFRIGYQKRGWDEGFEINGVGGRLVLRTPLWNEPEHDAPVLRFYDNASGQWTEYTFEIVCPFAEAERFFLGQVEKGQQGEQDRYTGYRADYLLEMTQRSVDQGRPLELSWEA
jgi:predicted dehydrogenase